MTTALTRLPPEKPEFIGLAKYDAMLNAIAECHSIDEAKKIHDISVAFEKYSKQAKNYDAELRAMDIRIRASVRCGQLIAQMEKAKGAIGHAGPGRGKKLKNAVVIDDHVSKPKTLAELGITKDQSSQWQQLAGIDPKEVEKQLPVATGRRMSVKKIIKKSRLKRDPAREREQKLRTLALRIWGRLRDLPTITEDMPLKEVVGAMDRQLVSGVVESLPKVRTFLSALEKEVRNAEKKETIREWAP